MSLDPSEGRFLTMDPIGTGDGPNEYEFCHDDPVDYVDPTGLDAVDVKFQDGPVVQNKYKNDNGDMQTGTGFVWSPTGLDSTKTYAQVNVTETTTTDNQGKSTTITDVIIDPVTLCVHENAKSAGLNGNEVDLPKGSYNDTQTGGHVVKNVKTIIIKNYVYVVEIKPPPKVPEPENGYKGLTCPENKQVIATAPPKDGAKLSDATAQYVKTDLQFEYTYVYDAANDDGNIFFHGDPFKNGQPHVAGSALSEVKDPDPNLGNNEIGKAFPTK